MPEPRILIIEDEKKTADALRLYLEHAGFAVSWEADGVAGLSAIEREAPALVVLDLMLPRLGGLEVCRRARQVSAVPILMLSARAAEDDILEGLAIGADDYVTKPFSPRTLVARVQALLRRSAPWPAPDGWPVIIHGSLVLDRGSHRVRVRDIVCVLTPREFRLLEVLMRSPGRAFTRDELIARAFGDDYEGFDRTVDVHVGHLRRKIEDDPAAPRRVVTVFGVGYRYEIVP